MADTSPTKAIGYIRVSTDQQADGGVSLDAQRAKLQAYALAMDVELVAIVEDAGVSAKTLARPGLHEALQKLELGQGNALLVTKLDRLTRSVRDLGEMVDRYFADRFSLMSVSDSIDTRSAAGRLVLNVLASVSQWEREATGERTKEALRHLRDSGVRLGGEGLGWRRAGRNDPSGRRTVVVVEEEQKALEAAICLRSKGLSLRRVAASLTELGHRTKRGGSWQAETVRKLLARPGQNDLQSIA